MRSLIKLILLLLWPALLWAQGGTPPGGYGPGSTGSGIASVATKNSGLSAPSVIYPNAPPYNISFDGQVCYYVTWPLTSTSVTCNSGTTTGGASAAVAGNVATITFQQIPQPFNPVLAGWNSGDSVVVSNYSGADIFYNGTFTLTGVTATTVTFALVHVNAGSTSGGVIQDTNVGPFKSTDTGKLGFGSNCSTPLVCMGTPGGKVTRPLGVVTYVSPTQVTVAGNSNAVQSALGGQFWWFTDDRSQWLSVDAAIGAAGNCVSIIAPAGITPWPAGFGNNNSPNCGVVTNGASGVGNTSRQGIAGNTLNGQGVASTTFLLPPDFDWTKCTANGGAASTCLGANLMGGGNFTITGGGNCQTGTNAVTIFGPSVSSTFWNNVTMTDFSCFDTASIGVNYGFANKFDGMYNSGFGGSACNMNGVNVILTNSYCGETRETPVLMNGSGTVVRTENFYVGASGSTIGVWVGRTGPLVWTSLHDQSYGAVAAGGTHIFIDAASTAYMTGWYNANGSAYGVELTATGKLFLRDSTPVNGTTHAIGTGGVTLTTGGFFNLGGNQFTGAALETTVLPSCSGNGGGTSPPACVIANSEGNNAFDVVIGSGSGSPSSTSTVTVTYAGTNQINSGILPNLQCNLTSGTAAWGNTSSVFLTTASATAPELTWTNSVNGVATALAASSTYKLSCQSEPN